MDLVQNLLIKITKLSMDLVHDRGSMDPVQRGGPWTPGPCFVLTRLLERLCYLLFIKVKQPTGFTCKKARTWK